MSHRKQGEVGCFTASNSQPRTGNQGHAPPLLGSHPLFWGGCCLCQSRRGSCQEPGDGAAGFCPWGQPASAHPLASLSPLPAPLVQTYPQDSKGWL